MTNMSYAYLTDKTGLSSILAQLLEPPGRPWAETTQELSEESDLALTLRSLLEPDRERGDSKQ